MELTQGEMIESGEIYAGMAELVMSAVADLRNAAGMCSKNEQYAKRQADTLLTLGCFWRTYANIFQFYGLHDLSVAENAGERNLRLGGFVTDELDNLAMTISHLEQHPETLVIAGRGRWGQCFGPDYLKEFKTKQYLMSRKQKDRKNETAVETVKQSRLEFWHKISGAWEIFRECFNLGELLTFLLSPFLPS